MSAATTRMTDVDIVANPTQQELRELALKHTPGLRQASTGGLNKVASRNKNRVAQWTYIMAPAGSEGEFAGNIIDPAKARELIEHQARYIQDAGKLIRLDRYLGVGPRATAVEWFYTIEGANIAGMQEVLAFSREEVEGEKAASQPFDPKLKVIYTPGCEAPGMPGGQAILVDLDTYTTYIMGPDYFGESKKGALRMLNDYLYKQGGLVMHAGAKVVTVGEKNITMAILGLSGTGKTTTTFAKHGEEVFPLQDDMVTIWPKGELSVTEAGCFAKTHGLTEETEPAIYRGTIRNEAWVENVYMDAKGQLDFNKDALTPQEVADLRDIFIESGCDAANVDQYIEGKVKLDELVDERGTPKDGWDFVVWSQNGRSIFPLSAIPNAADPANVPPVESLGILNRDEGPDAAMPGLVRFSSTDQAAGYFMLGETSKTSAAGKDRGKTRSPFTQPFFPRAAGLQARRFNELVKTMPELCMWLMNTGYVGGDDMDVKAGKALKVKIRHSSAMLEALLRDEIKWTQDPDFGYDVVDLDAPENAALLEKVPAEILRPQVFFEKAGRMDDYRGWVDRLKQERRAYLEKHKVDQVVIDAVCS